MKENRRFSAVLMHEFSTAVILRIMSRLIARILLTILMFPLAALIYLAVCVWYFQIARRYLGMGSRDEGGFIISGLVTWLFLAVYWSLLWRKSVQWNTSRTTWTFLTALLAAVVGVIISLILGGNSWDSFGIFLGSAAAPLLWLIATIFIWRETDSERGARLRDLGADMLVCPSCGYNLTGLHEARCPECGAQYTLNELLAGQPQRAQTELEDT
jgi:hypothetical protein